MSQGCCLIQQHEQSSYCDSPYTTATSEQSKAVSVRSGSMAVMWPDAPSSIHTAGAQQPVGQTDGLPMSTPTAFGQMYFSLANTVPICKRKGAQGTRSGCRFGDLLTPAGVGQSHI